MVTLHFFGQTTVGELLRLVDSKNRDSERFPGGRSLSSVAYNRYVYRLEVPALKLSDVELVALIPDSHSREECHRLSITNQNAEDFGRQFVNDFNPA